MKKVLSLALAAAMALSLLTGCGGGSGSSAGSGSGSGSVSASASGGSGSASGSDASAAGSSSSSDASSASGSSSGDVSADAGELPDFMVLSGPTGVGAAKMLSDFDADATQSNIGSYSVVAQNDEVTAALINGDADIAAIATNVAANLSAKTEGGIKVLAINTLGVLYILEKGETVSSMADLAGKTLLAPSTAKGANPEYILNHLLTENGVDPSQVDIQWMTPDEITAQITTSDAGICMLPVPAATALMVKDSAVRQAVSLSEAWDELNVGALPMGCVAVRSEYLEAYPQMVEKFLAKYEASIEYVNDEANREAAAQMVADLGIAPNAKVAAAAIPQCSLTFMTGADMKAALESYYEVLFQADPASIGGSMPYDDFYYAG